MNKMSKDSKLKLSKLEKWGLWALLAFILGWIGLVLYTGYGLGDPKITVKANDIKRLINQELYSDAANIHLPVYVDKVEIYEYDSITPAGNNFFRFRYRTYSQTFGKHWGKGTVEEKDMQFSKLQYALDEP